MQAHLATRRGEAANIKETEKLPGDWFPRSFQEVTHPSLVIWRDQSKLVIQLSQSLEWNWDFREEGGTKNYISKISYLTFELLLKSVRINSYF